MFVVRLSSGLNFAHEELLLWAMAERQQQDPNETQRASGPCSIIRFACVYHSILLEFNKQYLNTITI